jgi:hypothetical protein
MLQRRVGSLALVLLLPLGAGCAQRAAAPDVPIGDAQLDAARTDAGSCTLDAQCDDRIACTIDVCTAGSCVHSPCLDCCEGELVCDLSRGCAPAPTPCTEDADCLDTIRCTLDFCREGLCDRRPQSGLCDPGEICLGAVGCIPTPPETCETAADCAATAACVGEWQCEPEFGCQFVSVLDCSDDDACTMDSCSEAAGGCVHAPLDADGDAHPAETCGGDDCDDDDDTIHPGAAEICGDLVDQDCDGTADDGCCTAGPCTTACGTAGVFACNPDGTPGACMPPVETCDGRDEDCDTTVDETFACPLGASRPCMLGCAGAMGTQRCDAGCVWSACVTPSESCNGVDDNCDGAIDEGFACPAGTMGTCPTTCGSTGSRSCTAGCSWDLCVSPPEICNGADDDCDSACDDGFGCCRGTTRDCSALGFFAGSAVCRGDCSGFDTATCTNCGNGVRNGTEVCDGADLGGATCSSIGMGFAPGGSLRCAAGCGFDTSGCTRCGNAAIDAGEQCDGTNLGGATCSSLGMGFAPGGTLRCGGTCAYDTAMCSRCGNGTLDAGEQCDGTNLGGATCSSIGMGFSGGTLSCSGCRYATAACTAFDPSGFYSAAPPPTYQCAFIPLFGFYAVDLNITSFTFSDSGSLLTVSGAPCPMTGPSARTSRMINVTCTLPGGCAETYRLVGTFSTDNTWSGTFTASFSGGASACSDCTMRSFSVTGTR